MVHYCQGKEIMKKVSFKEFRLIYNKHLKELNNFWNKDMQSKIAKHNIGWSQPYSFKSYLELSVKRFYIAYKEIPSNVKTCCDIGGFWGIYPLVLKELGYEVTMTEALKYYDESFDQIFNYVSSNGVEIIDIDPFETEINRQFDYISIMAVLEHIPFSLEFFMGNIKNSMNELGYLYIEVPNVAYYYKRKNLLKGVSPLPKIETIYFSAIPFLGHHHEYSMRELKKLIELANLTEVNNFAYNYSITPSLKYWISAPIANLFFMLNQNSKEVISILASKKK
jgi:2-polyprenyl-3-methyl-5-hydroxy-6-metoxy-1,4-benzoquinol methylase